MGTAPEARAGGAAGGAFMRFFKQNFGKTAIFPEIFACAARHNLASGSGTPPAHACGALAAILQLCQVGRYRYRRTGIFRSAKARKTL